MSIIICLLGAAVFWTPFILSFAIFRQEISWPVMNGIAIIVSLSSFFALNRRVPSRFVARRMLLGIYLFGPLLLGVANTFVGGGFSQVSSWIDIFWLSFSSIFPPLLWVLAGTSGALPSLLVVTVFLGYTLFKKERSEENR
jgi:hypothetical protein